MATFPYPATGVILNLIVVHRARLDETEAETARLLRQEGHALQDIAAMLGTNQGRVCEAIGLTGRAASSGQQSLF